jgi:hypothetical protein
MKAIARVVAAAAVLLWAAGIASAAGSFLPEVELAPILDQVPSIRDFVYATLDLAESGSADRIGTEANRHLGGTRVGPYIIEARPKGSKGPSEFLLVFHTTYRFLDAHGAEVELAAATQVEERFDFLEIRPLVAAQ